MKPEKIIHAIEKASAEVPELVVLGSAGWIPQSERMTTSLALRFEDVLFLFDAGTGLARLLEDRHRHLIPAVDSPIHLFLSHLHLDHTIGLTFLPALWSNPTIVHFPAPAVEEVAGTSRGVFDLIFGGPFFPMAFRDLLPDISLEAMRPGEAQVEGHRISVRQQVHPGGSLGYRVDDMLAFITDTAYDPAEADFARGVQVLIHEAWDCELEGGPDPDSTGLNGHSSAEDAARVAKEATVGELLLSHLPPGNADCHAEMLARAWAIFPTTELCVDGMTRRLE